MRYLKCVNYADDVLFMNTKYTKSTTYEQMILNLHCFEQTNTRSRIKGKVKTSVNNGKPSS